MVILNQNELEFYNIFKVRIGSKNKAKLSISDHLNKILNDYNPRAIDIFNMLLNEIENHMKGWTIVEVTSEFH